LIYFNNIYLKKFGKYLLNLNDYLNEEHINMYKNEIVSKTCYYNDQLIALPFEVYFSVMYYNEKLLNKYGKSVPKTWDELLDIGKYIIEEERKLGNTEIIGYNGGFDDSDFGTISLYEFIYSFRESKDSPFPKLTSQTSKNALEKLKQIKEEIASDEIFKGEFAFSYKKWISNKLLFLKHYYNLSLYDNYKVTTLPGSSTGISGSVISGLNLGINKYIRDENKKAAITVFEYLTSKEVQKKLIIDRKILSSIFSLYDDIEVCKVVDCEVFLNSQLIATPTSQNKDYNDWSSAFRSSIYNYLYGNKTTSEVLREAKKSIENFSGSSSRINSLLGLFIFIFTYITYNFRYIYFLSLIKINKFYLIIYMFITTIK